MGTYLYEYVEEEPFENKDILLAQLKEVLRDLGECGFERMELFNKRIVYMDQDNFARDEEDENCVILAYNRFEHDKWEPTFLDLDPDKFTGIRSWAIGSKVGSMQHYYAMATARVLCECYSNGKYIVYGDIGQKTILHLLAYIWKRYGFDLVEHFIDNRLSVHNIVKNLDIADCYWGIRGESFYKEIFLKSNFKEWEDYVETVCSYKNDLTLCEHGEKPKYICTYAYLGVKLLYEVAKEKIEIENPKLDIEKLIDVFCSFSLATFKPCSEVKELFTTGKFPENLIKYEKFYEKYFVNFTLMCFYRDPEIVLKIIDEIIQEINKGDAKNIIRQFHSELEDVYANAKEIMYNIIPLYSESEKEQNAEIKRDIITEIKKIMDEEENLDGFSTDYPLLDELLRAKGTDFSEELDKCIKDVFSTEHFKCFVAEREKYKASEDFKDNFCRMSDIANKIYQEDQLLMTKNLVEGLLETLKQDSGKLRLELLHFFVDNSSGTAREAILWIIGDNELYKKYVLEPFEMYAGENTTIDGLKE